MTPQQTAIPGEQPSLLATAPQTSGKAIASLVLGLFAFLLPASILAVIFGHISRGEIARSGGRLKGSGIALAGLLLGYAGLAVIPILIIAAIAIPNLLRARISANEASAVSSIRTIQQAELSYTTSYSRSGYAAQLSNLGGATPCVPSPSTACLIDQTLASGTKTGYNFSAVGGSPVRGANTTYVIGAAPISFNQSGVRLFCSTEDDVIRWDSNSGKSTTPPSASECTAFTPLQ